MASLDRGQCGIVAALRAGKVSRTEPEHVQQQNMEEGNVMEKLLKTEGVTSWSVQV